MKKVLVLSAAILANSVFHAGATATTNTVQILYRADRHIPPGHTCTRHTDFFVPPTADGSISGIERMAQVQGVSSVWVVGVKIQVLTATSGNYQTCLNAPAPTGLNVTTMFFGIPSGG